MRHNQTCTRKLEANVGYSVFAGAAKTAALQ